MIGHGKLAPELLIDPEEHPDKQQIQQGYRRDQREHPEEPVTDRPSEAGDARQRQKPENEEDDPVSLHAAGRTSVHRDTGL